MDNHAQGIVENNQFIHYSQVEADLYNDPKVQEVGVVMKPSEEGKQILKVYLALEQGFTDEEEKQRYDRETEKYIRQKFSIHMPIQIFFRDKLPKTRSGKLLRCVLE